MILTEDEVIEVILDVGIDLWSSVKAAITKETTTIWLKSFLNNVSPNIMFGYACSLTAQSHHMKEFAAGSTRKFDGKFFKSY